MANKKSLFKPGQSGNPAGRPKGAVNKTTAEMKEFLNQITSEYFASGKMQEDLINMSPGTRAMLMERIFKYNIPTLSQSQVDVDANHSGDMNITVRFRDDNKKDEAQK